MLSKIKQWSLGKKDALIALILLAASSFTHLIFFGLPAAVVFDETYFLRFVGYYQKGWYFFDVHPPLGKLIFFWYGKLFGITPTVDIGSIGDALDPSLLFYRTLPMLAGTLLPIVIYYLCRHLNMSRLSAFIVGALICLENSLLVQSRIVVMDMLLVLFGFTSLLLFVIYYNRLSQNKSTKVILLGSALFFAAAGSIKWSGLFFFLPIFLFELHRLIAAKKELLNRIKHFISVMTTYALTVLIIYTSLFAIHFSLLKHYGPGDAFMTEEFNANHDELPVPIKDGVVPRGFFGSFFELNGTMFDATNGLTTAHPYSSRYYTWPIMKRPIYYWQDVSTKDDPTTSHGRIYLIGNPLIYWLGLASMIFIVLYALLKMAMVRSPDHYNEKTATFILAVFLGNFIPFIFIGRVMFLYHYAAALVASIMMIGFCLELIKNKKKKLIVATSILLVCLGTFIFFAPLTYGTPLLQKNFNYRMWMNTWQ